MLLASCAFPILVLPLIKGLILVNLYLSFSFPIGTHGISHALYTGI